jgi:FKBP-type peptidyl-prolyl cis-trans isomerase SlyD
VTLRCSVSDMTGAVLDDGSQPLVFVCGRQQILNLLETALVGKEPGHTCRMELPPEQAYGLHRPELVFEAVRDNLPQGLDIQLGMDLSPGGTDGKFNLKVVALTERGAMLDGNHRYAGKHLVFDMEVLNVEPDVEVSHA